MNFGVKEEEKVVTLNFRGWFLDINWYFTVVESKSQNKDVIKSATQKRVFKMA